MIRFLNSELVSDYRQLGVELSAEPGYYDSDPLNGLAKKEGVTDKDVDQKELELGIETEKEHTDNPEVAKQIALDHLAEHPRYYSEILLPAEKKAEQVGYSSGGGFNSGGPTTTGNGGIQPGQEQVAPGEVRIDAQKKMIDPANLIGLHGVDVKAMNELAEAITEKGYLSEHPILVVDTPLGLLLLDGHHRGHAAQSLKLKSIPALVVNWVDFTNLLMLRFGNALPKKARCLDKYIYIDGKPYENRSMSNGHDKSNWGTPSQWAHPKASVSSERFTCLCTCSVVDKAVEFCGKQYVPDQAKAYVVATMLTSLPTYTKTRRAWTAATIANSASSAQNQLLDREHTLRFYNSMRGTTRDDVVGTIVEYDFPDKKKAMELAAEGKGVPFRVLLSLFRKVQGIEQMIDEIPSNNWRLSQECEYDREESAFYDMTDKKFFKYAECNDEMKSILKRNTVDNWNGHPMLFCPGGEDGAVLFSGCAMTRWPLDVTAKTESMAASEEPNATRKIAGFNYKESDMQLTRLFQSLTCADAWRTEEAPDELFGYVPSEARGKNGKKSLRKFPLASKQRKGLDPAILRNALARFSQADLPGSAKASVKAKILSAIKRWNAAHPNQKIEVSEKSGGEIEVSAGWLYAGCTMAAEKYPGCEDGTAENHTHAIMSNGLVIPHGGHSHGLEIMNIDLGEGTLEAVTTSAYDYLNQPAVPGEIMSASSKEYKHKHVVRLTKDSVSNGETDVTGALVTAMSCHGVSGNGKDLQMTRQEVCAGLRERAAKLKDTDAEAAAILEKNAVELEKEASADSVQATIESQIKAGTLITKEAHEQAVSSAKQAGKDELQKEISAKEEAVRAQNEATTTRLASVVSAGLKPEMVLGKDRTIQSVVSSLPVGEEGDKQFADRLEEWTYMLKAAATTKKESTASAGSDQKLHVLGAAEVQSQGQAVKLSKEQRTMAIL